MTKIYADRIVIVIGFPAKGCISFVFVNDIPKTENNIQIALVN